MINVYLAIALWSKSNEHNYYCIRKSRKSVFIAGPKEYNTCTCIIVLSHLVLAHVLPT